MRRHDISDHLLYKRKRQTASGGPFDPRDCSAAPVSTFLLVVQRRLDVHSRHGHECLLHEGSEVLSGTKYVLRSDIMFMT